MTEVIQYLEIQIAEIKAWLETDEARQPTSDKQYIIGLDGLYAGLKNVLYVNPLKAVRFTLPIACAAARATYDEKGENFGVCVLRDAATNALYTLKDMRIKLFSIEGDMENG